jgi:peptidoglycan/LPS O-acetylase OafA/YrhL
MNEPSAPARKVAVVNGLRGVAILAVIWHHVFARYTPTGWKSVSVAGVVLPIFAPLADGWLGVDLFFVLSASCFSSPTRRAIGCCGTARASSTTGGGASGA